MEPPGAHAKWRVWVPPKVYSQGLFHGDYLYLVNSSEVVRRRVFDPADLTMETVRESETDLFVRLYATSQGVFVVLLRRQTYFISPVEEPEKCFELKAPKAQDVTLQRVHGYSAGVFFELSGTSGRIVECRDADGTYNGSFTWSSDRTPAVFTADTSGQGAIYLIVLGISLGDGFVAFMGPPHDGGEYMFVKARVTPRLPGEGRLQGHDQFISVDGGLRCARILSDGSQYWIPRRDGGDVQSEYRSRDHPEEIRAKLENRLFQESGGSWIRRGKFIWTDVPIASASFEDGRVTDLPGGLRAIDVVAGDVHESGDHVAFCSWNAWSNTVCFYTQDTRAGVGMALLRRHPQPDSPLDRLPPELTRMITEAAGPPLGLVEL